MGEKMTNAQAAEILRQHNAWRRGNDDEMPDAPVNPTRLGKAIDHAVAYLTQPAQAADVGAEDRFEQYVKTLIDKAPDVQRLGERLAHWLDDDQFNNIEPILLGIARQLAALPNANGKEG